MIKYILNLPDAQIYIQICILILFIFLTTLKFNVQHADYISPKSIIETYKMLSFAQANLNEEDQKKLNIEVLVSEQFKSHLPSKYARLLANYLSFNRNKIFTYSDFELDDKDADSEKIPEEQNLDFFTRVLFGLFAIGIVLFGIFAVIFSYAYSILLSPVIVFYLRYEMIIKKKNINWNILVHPQSRSQLLLYQLGSLCSIAILYLVYLIISDFDYTIPHNQEVILIDMITILLVPVLFTFYCFLLLIARQKQWKEKWSEIFDYIMQRATQTNDHDLYNRAYLYYDSIQKFPAIPLSDTAKTYIAINASLQILISYLFKTLG